MATLFFSTQGTKRSGHMTASQSTGNGFLWMLLAPLIAIWNFIYAFLFPPMPARAGNQNAERLENRSSGSMGNDQSSTPRQRSRFETTRARHKCLRMGGQLLRYYSEALHRFTRFYLLAYFVVLIEIGIQTHFEM